MKHIQRLSERKNIFLIAAVGWTSFTTYLSLSEVKVLPGFEIENADKGVHFIFHLVFTICWYLFLNFGYGFRFKILRIAFLLSLFYGIAIEFCQEYLTTYRSGDPMDVLANSVGALSAVIAMFILQKSLKLIQ